MPDSTCHQFPGGYVNILTVLTLAACFACKAINYSSSLQNKFQLLVVILFSGQRAPLPKAKLCFLIAGGQHPDSMLPSGKKLALS